MTKLKDLKAWLLKDPQVRKEYDALEEEIALMAAIAKARLRAGLSQAELEADWQREAVYAPETATSGTALAPWLVLTGLVLLTPLLFLLLTARARPAQSRML